MKNIRIYLFSFLCFFSANLFAQNDCLDDCTDMLGLPRKEVYLPDTLRYLVMGDTTRAKTTTNKRVVYFVHGIGGSETSWGRSAAATQVGYEKLRDTFPAFNVTSLQPVYKNNQSSMNDAATQVFNFMKTDGAIASNENKLEDREQNFVIAHSMGGLISRNILTQSELKKEKHFGGLVTFGTPHQGAKLTENILKVDDKGNLKSSDSFEQVIEEACNALIEGPARDQIDTLPLVKYLSVFIKFDSLKTKICDRVPGILTTLGGFEKELVKPIAYQMRPSGDFIKNLNDISLSDDRVIKMPKVAFYGTEEPSVFWRSANSFEGSNNINDFQSGDDDKLMGDANFNLNLYRSKAAEWDYKMNLFQSLGGIGKEIKQCKWYEYALGICIIKSTANTLLDFHNARDTRDAWQEGVNWWLNIDDTYQALLGARVDVYNTVTECTCLDESGTPIPCDQAQVPIFQNKYCGYEYQQYQTTYFKANDGVVLAESAMNLPNLTYPPIEMIGSNHFQMRNDQNTKKGLIDVLSGRCGKYFNSRYEDDK